MFLAILLSCPWCHQRLYYAYMTEHLQRFGDYTLKLRPVASRSNEEAASPEPLSEDGGASEELSA